MRTRANALLLATGLFACPTLADANPWAGIGIGVYGHSNTVTADSTFSAFGSSVSDESDDDTSGLGIKLSYRSFDEGFGYSFDARLQNLDADIDLYGDSRLEVNALASVGTSLGYMSGPHFLYGVLEVGQTSVDYRVDGYGSSSEGLLSFGLGAGYTFSVTDNVELNAEIIGRALQDLEIDYTGGAYAGVTEEIDITVGTVSLGLSYRF